MRNKNLKYFFCGCNISFSDLYTGQKGTKQSRISLKNRKETENMKKLIALILGVLTICSLAACAGKNDTAAGGNSSALSPDKTQSAEIPNPFVDCDTLEDAQKLADFDFAFPNPSTDMTPAPFRRSRMI
jgi:hypothetical protein